MHHIFYLNGINFYMYSISGFVKDFLTITSQYLSFKFTCYGLCVYIIFFLWFLKICFHFQMHSSNQLCHEKNQTVDKTDSWNPKMSTGRSFDGIIANYFEPLGWICHVTDIYRCVKIRFCFFIHVQWFPCVYICLDIGR